MITKLQAKFVPLLREYFPKVVFYITSVLPAIFSKLQSDELYQLSENIENVVTVESNLIK
jgi:hypothetical protein